MFPFVIIYVSDQNKTWEMCDKVIKIDDMLKFCLSEKFGNKLK